MSFNNMKDFLFFFFANLGSQATGTLIAVAGSLSGVLAGSILKLLEAAEIRLNNAYIRFRYHLPNTELIGFDNAWKEYCHPQGGNPKQMPGPYLEYFIDIPLHDSINLIIEKMEKLLSFAKPK